jgi:hypothetical protein
MDTIDAPSKFVRASRPNALRADGWQAGSGDFNDQRQLAANPGRSRSKQ